MADLREADWELFNLLTEFRRRVRALRPEALAAEPQWISALPSEDAQIARSMLAATRAWASRAKAQAVGVPAEAAPGVEVVAPRRRRKRTPTAPPSGKP